MKSNLKASLTIFAALFLVAGVAFAEPSVVKPGDLYLGMTYGDWSATWWQYVAQTPNANNVLFGNNTVNDFNCLAGQDGSPVVFLVGLGPVPGDRTCSVPYGKAIFFPIINYECSTLEPVGSGFHGDNEYALRACASNWANPADPKSLKVTVDGAPLQHLDLARVQSPVFSFTSIDAAGIFGIQGTGWSVSDGYWVMLNPLSRGTHTLHFEGINGSNHQDVTYILLIN